MRNTTGWLYLLPILKYRKLLKIDKNASVTKSPRLAAMGVATLSGLILYFFEKTITAHMIAPSSALASAAVISELAHIKKVWLILKLPLGTHRNTTAAIDAKAATTKACA